MEADVANRVANEFDWEEIAREFQCIRDACLPFRVLTGEDLEPCKLSDLTYGMIPSDHVEKIRSWDYISVHNDEKRDRLIDLSYVSGFADDGSKSSVEHQLDRPDLWGSIE